MIVGTIIMLFFVGATLGALFPEPKKKDKKP